MGPLKSVRADSSRGVIIQSYQQLVRQLSSRLADKGFCPPEADGSDLFLCYTVMARQSLKLKARTTFNKTPHFYMITLTWVYQPVPSKVGYGFVLY